MGRAIPKSQRLARLERHLAGLPEGARVTDLAEWLGVHRATVYRDLEALEQVGLPIWQEAGRVGLLVEKYLAPLRLNIFEALSLFIATRLLSRQSKERDPHVESLLEKLAETLPPPVSQHVLQSVEVSRSSPENEVYIRTLETLMRAWVNGRTVRMWYKSGQKDTVKERRFDIYFIEPIHIVYSSYVIGFDHSYGEVRTFKIKRIQRIELTGESYRIPAKFDIFKRWASSWGTTRAGEGPEVQVKLRFSRDIAFMIKETVWHPSQKIQDTDDGGCLFTAMVDHLEGIKLWLRAWGPNVEVLEPANLRLEVAREAKNLYSFYRDVDLLDAEK